MSEESNANVVIAVRLKGEIRWFRSDRDLWVLDVTKWRDEFISNGYDVPEFDSDYRFGILSVNQDNAGKFLSYLSEYELDKDQLSFELATRFQSASSWWDVGDLFPIMFVNFDNCCVGAFYHEGVAMERYLPDGWSGEFVDFANEYGDDIFPVAEKFWVKNGSDILQLLNARASENS